MHLAGVVTGRVTGRSSIFLVGCLAIFSGCFGGRAGKRGVPEVTPTEGPFTNAVRMPTAAPGPRPGYRSALTGGVTEEDIDALWERQLMVPVEGVSHEKIRDDFSAGRGNRVHGAVDIIVPRYSAVIAADDGVVGRLTSGSIGGIVIYVADLSHRFVYYYAHLQRYRNGLAVGDTVAKGTVIGYVGTSGNAPENIPHLHFQVMKRGTGRAWWDGPAINPYNLFAFDGVRR